MADQSTHNSTLEELEKYLNDEHFRQMLESRNETPCTYIKHLDEYMI